MDVEKRPLLADIRSRSPRCDAPTNRVDRVARAKAKDSPTVLRQFVTRTQSIYRLDCYDYLSPQELDRHDASQEAQAAQVTAQAREQR
jgi:hypothetical protein